MMQKFAAPFFLFFTLLAFSACGSKDSFDFEVRGKNPDASEVVIVKLMGDDIEPIDTLDLDDDGAFVFKGTFTDPTFVFFSFDDGRRVPVILTGKKTRITFEVDDPNGYGIHKISGTKEADRLQRLQDFAGHAFAVIDSLDQLISASEDLDDEERKAIRSGADQVFVDLMKSYKQKLERFIDEDSTSLSNLFVFNQRMGNMPILDIQESPEYFDKVSRNLSATYPNEPNIAFFTRNLAMYREQVARERMINEAKDKLVDGSEAPEIALEDLSGNIRKLSSLRGKVVLVDFWASWCQPCRVENPNLVRMYENFKAKGFEVFSVSLDGLDRQMDPRQEWMDAITADNLSWEHHVSDLKGWDTPLLEQYGFTGIPFTVLVDRDGKVIAKNLRGQALEDKLKEIL
jgi:thiol-disulfide isomerase/thioredoxin